MTADELRAEQIIVGFLLLEPLAHDELASELRAGDFQDEWCGRIYESIGALVALGSAPAVHEVCKHAQQAAGTTLEEAIKAIDAAFELGAGTARCGIESHIADIKARSRLRQATRLFDAMANRCARGAEASNPSPHIVDDALDALQDGLDALSGTKVELVSWVEVIEAGMDLLGDRITGGADDILPTGLRAFDALTGGLPRGMLSVLCARPTKGKSVLAQQWAEHVARTVEGVVLYYSLEMPGVQHALRSFASNCSINHAKIQGRAELNDMDLYKISRFTRDLTTLGELRYPSTRDLTVKAIRSEVCRLDRRARAGRDKPPMLVVVDYVQRLHGAGRSRFERVAGVSEDLADLAKDLGVAVLAVSQLNREVEHREDGRPRIADIRESGQIEQDATLIVSIHREDNASGDCELEVLKSRNGMLGRAEVRFRGEYQRFEDRTAPKPDDIEQMGLKW